MRVGRAEDLPRWRQAAWHASTSAPPAKRVAPQTFPPRTPPLAPPRAPPRAPLRLLLQRLLLQVLFLRWRLFLVVLLVCNRLGHVSTGSEGLVLWLGTRESSALEGSRYQVLYRGSATPPDSSVLGVTSHSRGRQSKPTRGKKEVRLVCFDQLTSDTFPG